jgi:hypothetical protein
MASSIFDIFDNQAQTQAAAAQTAGINAGYGQLSNLYGQGQQALQTNYAAGLQPFQQNYGQAQQGTQALGNALGLNGPSGNQQASQALQSTPGYQFQLQQGDNAVNAQAAANGTSNSGNQALALSQFNQGLAGTTYNNYVNQLQPYLGASNNAAQGIGSLSSGLGNQLNASNMQQGNAAYGAQTSIGNANANAALGNLNASGNIMNAGINAGAGLLGFISDARAKEDIKKVGELHDGQNVYRYKYKGDHRHQIGLIAQEVEKHVPEAVFDATDDLKGVNYTRATDYSADLARFVDEPTKDRGIGYAEPLKNMAA